MLRTSPKESSIMELGDEYPERLIAEVLSVDSLSCMIERESLRGLSANIDLNLLVPKRLDISSRIRN